MSEITRYSEFKYDAGLYADDVDGDWCKYDDIAPIIQRNAELETENSVQRLQIEHLESELARLHRQEPVVWEVLYRGKGIAYFDHVPQSGDIPDNSVVRQLYADPKPAQIPLWLTNWVDTNFHPGNPEYLYAKGYRDAQSFVNSQLDKMKGGA